MVFYLACLIALRGIGSVEWLALKGILQGKAEEVRVETPKTDSRITIHCRVINEERFVRSSLLSVLPLAEKILVYDTGSTDETIKEIASLGSRKIEIVKKSSSDARGICEYRNEMIDRTTTGWFMLVDGDEIYPESAIRKIQELMPNVPAVKHRILLHRKHFIDNYNFISRKDSLGRIYRTRVVRFRLYDPTQNQVGHETPYLPEDPSLPLEEFSMKFPEDVLFFHMHHLTRSSKDAELGPVRRWRRLPFPLFPYFGPWPETLEMDGVHHRLGLDLLNRCMALNAKIIWERLLRSGTKDKRRMKWANPLKMPSQRDHGAG
jgi:glycosyltransferase involved in cell wall biosynthesis